MEGGIVLVAEEAKQGLAGRIEQPDERRARARQNHHRGGDADRDTFRILERDLFRNEFADDQRQIGDRDDDDADARGFGEMFRETLRLQEFAQAQAERGTRECAGHDADQRDADLDRRKKPSGVLGETERGSRAGDALFLEHPQPRGAGRHDGQFGHREKAVDHREYDDDRNFKRQSEHASIPVAPCGEGFDAPFACRATINQVDGVWRWGLVRLFR